MTTLRDRWEALVVAVYTRTPERPRRAVQRLVTPGWRVGVLVVLSRPDGRILLVDQTYTDGWALPGGDIKRGEDLVRAAERELREELGLTVAVPRPVLAEARPHDRWVTFVTRLEVSDAVADQARAPSPELRGLGWFAPGDLPPVHRDTVAPLRLAGVLEPAGPAAPTVDPA
jgi:8-oxo-dGTP pyrophosphatase MutT (NUDIX family)